MCKKKVINNRGFHPKDIAPFAESHLELSPPLGRESWRVVVRVDNPQYRTRLVQWAMTL